MSKGTSNNSSVAIIGTGDFARAMAMRLLRHGYLVKLHSRYPEKRRMTSCRNIADVEVVGWHAGFDYANYVIAAMPDHAHRFLEALSSQLIGRVVIDVSNPTTPVEGKSNAEALQAILPQSHVVKAFNSISTYTLQSDTSGESRVVHVCGNDVTSRQSVVQLARDIGLVAVEGGSLRGACVAEKEQSQLCPQWANPLILFTVLMVLWTVYATIRYYVLREPPYDWYRFPTNVMNKVFGCVSLTLLAFVYLPGSVAAILQLARGTKYRPFPGWLDGWLKMRKQLGLLALFIGWLHVLMSITILNSAYFDKWFNTKQATVKANSTADTVVPHDSRMNLNGELNVFFGLLGGAFMVIPGIASIPAVGSLLNWREWKVVQTGFGLVAMAFATTHVTLKGAYDWRYETFGEIVQSMAFVSSFLPWLCFALIIVLWTPCLCLPLRRIRAGWERGVTSSGDHDDEADVIVNKSTTRMTSTVSPQTTNLGANGVNGVNGVNSRATSPV